MIVYLWPNDLYMLFQDRVEAGQKLAASLEQYRGIADVVLALPQGGVICANEVSKHLNIPLDLVFAKVVTHPNWPEHIIGGVGESGNVVLRSESVVVDKSWLDNEIFRHRAEMKNKRHLLLTNKPQISLKNKTIIIVDEGIKSSVLMEVVIESVRYHGVKGIIIGVPFAEKTALKLLRPKVNDVVAVYNIDEPLESKRFYSIYPDVEDKDILNLLNH